MGRGRRKAWAFGLAAAAWILGASGTALAADSELDAIRAALREAGNPWWPADNPVRRLAPAERTLRAGALAPATVDPSIGTFRRPAVREALPPRLDWRSSFGRNFVTPVRDQGGCGSCWAFAATAALESALLIQQDRDASEWALDRSEQDVLSCSRAGNCIGGFTDGALAYLAQVGAVDEPCFPYGQSDLACGDKCRDWDGRTLRARAVEAVGNTVDDIKASLQHGPTTACFSVYGDFYSYGGGVYRHVQGDWTAAHSVLVVGYDDAKAAWLCKNSWGEGWGEDGFFWIAWGEADFGWCALRVVRNEAPRIPWLPAVVALPGQALEVPVAALDPDGDPLAWDVAGLDTMAGATLQDGVFRWTPPPGAAGTWDVAIRVTDDWTPAGEARAVLRVSACPGPCDDGDPCTDDVCPGGACTHVFNEAPCEADGNPCTRDACHQGACHAALPDGSACDDDGNDCTADVCRDGACGHAALDDGAACADDGNDCTRDACREGACTHVPVAEGSACAADWEACTADVCREGACVHEPMADGEPCGEADACSEAACLGGTCNYGARPDGWPCDDRQACTTGDACQSGSCRGTAPQACEDGLWCTRDGCRDGAGFAPSALPLDDLGKAAIDTGLEGDQAVAGPFDVGFAFPLGDTAPRTRFWVAVDGVLSFGGPVWQARGEVPSPSAPDDLVAALWDDLECPRSEGCRIAYAVRGVAPTRRLVVQWSGLRRWGVPSSRATFQAILYEAGRVDLRYGDLFGVSGRGAAVGIEDAAGRGAAWLYDAPDLGPGLSLHWDPSAAWTCTQEPDKGACVVGHQCWLEGDLSPDAPCRACQPGLAWRDFTPAVFFRCDDGDACTFEDLCGVDGCSGNPYGCDDGNPCTLDACDGGGGCLWTPVGDGGGCDDGSVCTVSDQCRDGRCQGTGLADGSPCDDKRACTSHDACAAGTCAGAVPAECTDGVACTDDGCTDAPVPGGFECANPLAPGRCLIDGACWNEKDANPANACQRCWGWNPHAWSFDWGARCDDGDACTYGDTCQEGGCAGTVYACTSDDPCWTGRCDGTGQCRWTAHTGGCDDRNPCTGGDACTAGVCAGTVLADGTPCEDGQACTAGDACAAGTCVGATAACDDGLDCTRDACVDGAAFAPGGGAFEDLSATGRVLEVDSQNLAWLPIEPGFPLRLADTDRSVVWPRPFGVLHLGNGLKPPVFEEGQENPCLPSPAVPDGTVAAYWDELSCFRSEGCSIRWEVRGEAPARRLVVQWTRVRHAWEPGVDLSFQAALFEDGAIEFRYGKATGANGSGATAGIQVGTQADARAIQAACGGAWMAPGRTLRYDPAATFTCRAVAVDGACVLDGACRADGEPHPGNPCLACRDGQPAWAWTEGPCDDGDPCSAGEQCFMGRCEGKVRECRPAACDLSSTCDGQGGCATVPAAAGKACGAPRCEKNWLVAAPECDGEGACVPVDGGDCRPWACRDGACTTSCEGGKDCGPDAWCDLGTGTCTLRGEDGAPCADPEGCLSGHCGNGFCCVDGTCCAADLDCPLMTGPSPLCTDPAACQGVRQASRCTLDHRCEAAPEVDDDSACTSDAVQDCGWSRDHTCDGTADQPAFACPGSCDGDGDCDPDAFCAGGTCRPRGNHGEACGADGDCTTGHCRGGFCCAAGDCCRSPADCPASYTRAPACDDPGRCQGSALRAACSVKFQCLSEHVDDDSGCGAGTVVACGAFPDLACTGAADQVPPACAAACVTDADCDPGARCADRACYTVPPVPDADAAPDVPDPGVPDPAADVPAGGDGPGGGCGAGAGTGGPGALSLGVLGLLGLLLRRSRRRPDAPAVL